MMEEELRAILLADVGVQGLVSDRINFGEHPQGLPWPGIVMNTISNVDGIHMKGRNCLWEGRVQIDCYALTYGEATLLARQVNRILSFYRAGNFRGIFQSGMQVGRENEDDLNAAERVFRARLDFETKWREEDE